MRYHLRITRLLILFYLLGTFISAAHIHKDATEVHTECKICLLSDSMHGGDVAAEPLDTFVLPNYALPLNFLHVSNVNPTSQKVFTHKPLLFLLFHNQNHKQFYNQYIYT